MTNVLALALVLLTAFYFVSLAVVAFAAPARVTRFLFGFATSAGTHYLELSIRMIVGAAFLLYAPEMLFSTVFTAFGWILVGTTACLFVIPWQWHQKIAQRAVPEAVRYLKLVAVASFAVGVFMLVAVALGTA
ncbi:MAG: hypothetical protein LH481_15945 [Burkholderiales bacterium]|nr:hypothetical protein [Burkholderiales bacterium]